MFDRLAVEGARCAFPGWRLVSVTGRDSERFLNSQLTADVAALADGRSTLSALLDRSGRLQAFFFVGRVGDGFRLLVPAEALAAAITGLEANLISDRVEIASVATPAMHLAIGPATAEMLPRLNPAEVFALEIYGHRGFVAWTPEVPDLPELNQDQVETLRVLSGLPRWGLDARSGQLVNETALVETAVNHHKGCYLGQETVHKLHTRRGAAHAVTLLEVCGEAEVDPRSLVGTDLCINGRKAGTVHSWARWNQRTYLNARLRRELRVHGRELCFEVGEGRVIARVEPLPLLVVAERKAEAEQLFLRSVRASNHDRDDEAVELLERAVAVCPDFADAYEALGVIHRRRGAHEAAITALERLLEVDPGSVMAHTNLSVIYAQLGRIEEAERELAEASKARLAATRRQREDSAELERRRSREHREIDEREQMFKQILELDPEDPLANFGIGELFVRAENYEQAAAHLRRALAADPKHSAAFLALGRALEGAGNLDEAIKTYTDGIEVAAAKGALLAANQMQDRLTALAG